MATKLLADNRAHRSGAIEGDRLPGLSRLQRCILLLLQLRGGRLWLVDLACELRNEGANAEMVTDALQILVQHGLVNRLQGAYEVTERGGRTDRLGQEAAQSGNRGPTVR
jgi:hypothetical protein